METITNVASTAATTVSNLIYGQPAKDNETRGNEPVSGEQGKGTAAEPFDKGNSEDPTTSTNETTSASDDFLKLNPAVGKSANTDAAAAADVKTGTSNGASMPIVPLNPDAANLGSTSTATGVTDKAGVADTVWKPTPLDEVKPSGAPGAGPEPPAHVTPATPAGLDGASAFKGAATESAPKAAPAKDTSATKDTHGSGLTQTTSISPEVDAVIAGEHPNVKHSVPEREAESSEAKMEDRTTRNTNMASKPDTTGEAPVVDNSDKKTSESKSDTKSPERSSSNDKTEEKDSKMANLKDKLKTKLHIGSKDK